MISSKVSLSAVAGLGEAVFNRGNAGLAKRFKDYSDFILFAFVVAVFIIVAAQRLGAVPVPDTDEAYTLQVPYEMLNRGQLSLPMYRYLGGNIENVWHSYTPVFFVTLTGFFKLFGWGVLQGRAFNLMTAALTLLMVYLISRRLFDWRAGLIAVTLLILDPVFVERSRLLRNDYAAAFCALLAYYLYEVAEERKGGAWYVASGLAAGAGVMCHTNALYMLGTIGLLMMIRHGWRVIRKRSLFQFTFAALAVMAYEIVYDLIDYKNFLIQNRGDKLHFGILGRWGWLENLVAEPSRYVRWYAGSEMFSNIPRTTLHIFQILSGVAVIYLVIVCIQQIKRGKGLDHARARILLATVAVVLFHAVVTSHKNIYYLAHLAPWFAICVGVMLRDWLLWIAPPNQAQTERPDLKRRVALIVTGLAAVSFVYPIALQTRRYIREVRNPELATFDEFKEVLRSVVPDDLCPIALKSPVMWLAFPEHDRCFANVEDRMMKALDLDGNDYALLIPNTTHRVRRTRELDQKYLLLATLHDTPYGELHVYYTGTDPRHLSLSPMTYYFFGKLRGHVSAEQISRSTEVWAAGPAEFGQRPVAAADGENPQEFIVQPPPRQARGYSTIELCAVDLKAQAIYQIAGEVTAEAGRWELLVLDRKTGTSLHKEQISGHEASHRLEGVFKTGSADRVTLVVRQTSSKAAAPLRISRMAIREIPPA
ncbi:MAG: glycosyltransferase family 39 protein [Acidobacteriota bacterium]